jgi:hypothetical protein
VGTDDPIRVTSAFEYFIEIATGAKIRTEFNTTDGKAGLGRRKAYSRGDWATLTLVPLGDTGAVKPE